MFVFLIWFLGANEVEKAICPDLEQSFQKSSTNCQVKIEPIQVIELSSDENTDEDGNLRIPCCVVLFRVIYMQSSLNNEMYMLG